jgi:hypothetical protein
VNSPLQILGKQQRVQLNQSMFLTRRGNAAILSLRPPSKRPSSEIEIVQFVSDGTIIFNSNGQQTPAVKHAMNIFLPRGCPWSVYGHGWPRRKWYLVNSAGKQPVPFVDGIRINPDGTVTAPASTAA